MFFEVYAKQGSKSGYFEGMVGTVSQELSFRWVRSESVFDQRYVDYVVSNSRRWFTVPEGNSRKENNPIPVLGPMNWVAPTKDYPPMWLRQCPGNEVCAYASMASALYYAGDTVTANQLKRKVDAGYGCLRKKRINSSL